MSYPATQGPYHQLNCAGTRLSWTPTRMKNLAASSSFQLNHLFVEQQCIRWLQLYSDDRPQGRVQTPCPVPRSGAPVTTCFLSPACSSSGRSTCTVVFKVVRVRFRHYRQAPATEILKRTAAGSPHFFGVQDVAGIGHRARSAAMHPGFLTAAPLPQRAHDPRYGRAGLDGVADKQRSCGDKGTPGV